MSLLAGKVEGAGRFRSVSLGNHMSPYTAGFQHSFPVLHAKALTEANHSLMVRGFQWTILRLASRCSLAAQQWAQHGMRKGRSRYSLLNAPIVACSGLHPAIENKNLHTALSSSYPNIY